MTGIAGAVTGSFGYDGVGRRRTKTIAGVKTDYLYDGLNFVQEKNGATVNANLLTGQGIDEVHRRTQGAASSDILPDALGSTVALADTTRALTTQYTYAPYGETTQTGAANNNTQKFTGREDDGTGLMYYRARYYSPTYGRFTAEDPIGIAGGVNIYRYADNSPAMFADPLGMQSYDPFMDIGSIPAHNPQTGAVYPGVPGDEVFARNTQQWFQMQMALAQIGAIAAGGGTTTSAGVMKFIEIISMLQDTAAMIRGEPVVITPKEADPAPYVEEARKGSRLPKKPVPAGKVPRNPKRCAPR